MGGNGVAIVNVYIVVVRVWVVKKEQRNCKRPWRERGGYQTLKLLYIKHQQFWGNHKCITWSDPTKSVNDPNSLAWNDCLGWMNNKTSSILSPFLMLSTCCCWLFCCYVVSWQQQEVILLAVFGTTWKHVMHHCSLMVTRRHLQPRMSWNLASLVFCYSCGSSFGWIWWPAIIRLKLSGCARALFATLSWSSLLLPMSASFIY